MNQAQAEAASSATHWRADLHLGFAHRRDSTRLVVSEHRGPLYVQRPFYPEGPDCAHTYILHPPGGLVSGDELCIRVELGENTKALLTTPGAGRAYRARDNQTQQVQQVRLTAASGAQLEWFPLETIAFPGADVALHTEIDLAADARLAAWEVSCFGLPAVDARFDQGRFEQGYRVSIDGRPVFVDRFAIGDHNRHLIDARAALQGQPVYGFFLMGPFAETNDDTLVDSLRAIASHSGYQRHSALTRVGNFYLGRYLGPSAEQARRCFQGWWRELRPLLLDRPAKSPRIWLT
ncbi:MAG: urease accessory protein UreD [Pseudomonadota bacterium]